MARRIAMIDPLRIDLDHLQTVRHDRRDREPQRDFDLASTSGEFSREAEEGQIAWEDEAYSQMCWQWRNIPKPCIATAQCRTTTNRLMLPGVADNVAADDIQLSDPVVGMGIDGIEDVDHPRELGAGQAKELLFTGDFFSIQQVAHAHDRVRFGIPVDAGPGKD